MMPSEVALLRSVETSVFHGFGASKSCPGAVVVVVEPLVEVDVLEDDEVEVELVVGITVDVEELVLGRDVLELEAVDDDVVLEIVVAEVEVEVEVVVGFVVDVDEVVEVELLELALEDVLNEVLVVDVEVVVVFFRPAALTVDDPLPHTHAPQAWPSAQSATVSHCSPPSASSRPSPQVDLGAWKRRRLVARALNVPINDAQDTSSTIARIRTLRSAPHACHRACSVLRPPRRRTCAGTGGQPLVIVAMPSASMTIASKGSSVLGTRAGATRKRMPGQGGEATAVAGGAATSARASSTRQRLTIVAGATAAGPSCATPGTVAWRGRPVVSCFAHGLVAGRLVLAVRSMAGRKRCKRQANRAPAVRTSAAPHRG